MQDMHRLQHAGYAEYMLKKMHKNAQKKAANMQRICRTCINLCMAYFAKYCKICLPFC